MDNDCLLSAQTLEHLHQKSKELYRHRPATGANTHAGAQQSKQRGAGLELHDLQRYQPGDDVRHMAWRASARSNEPLLKVFHAEKQTRRLLIIDQHPGMYFGTRHELKAAIAVRVAALLCFSALNQNSEIGSIAGTQSTHFYPFSRQLYKTLDFIRSINIFSKNKKNIPPDTLIKHSQNIATKACEIYVISDFLNWDKNTLMTLRQLAEQHTLHAIQIIDRGEYELPDVGKIQLTSPDDNHLGIIDSQHKKLRQAYKEEMAQRQYNIENTLRQQGIALIKVHTDSDPMHALEPLL